MWCDYEGYPRPTEIMPNHLYLSGCSSVLDADLLKKENIRYIINAAHDVSRKLPNFCFFYLTFLGAKFP